MKKILISSLCIVVATSCTKKPQLSEDTDGPEAQATEVQQAIAKAWGDVDPLTIRKNEFAYFEGTQKIQDLPAQMFMQEGLTVTNKVLSADQTEYDYTIAHQTKEIASQGESKSSTVEEHVTVPNTVNASMKAMSLAMNATDSGTGSIHSLNLGIQTVYNMLGACVKATDRDVSCHNLTYTEEVQVAPSFISQQENCAGLVNCKIHLRKVSFDYIFTDINPDTQTSEKTKVQFSMTMSPDVPYLSRLMDYCYRGLYLVPSAGQKVLLQVCSTVQGFKIGTPDPVATTPTSPPAN